VNHVAQWIASLDTQLRRFGAIGNLSLDKSGARLFKVSGVRSPSLSDNEPRRSRRDC